MIPHFPGEAPRDLSKPLEQLRLLADEKHDSLRLDQALCAFLHWRSRTSVRRLIEDGLVTLADGRSPRPSTRIRKGDVLVVRVPQPAEPVDVAPGGFEIPILYEDLWMVAVDKPPGLAVHPAGRRVHGTLIHHLHKRYRHPEDPAHDVVPRLLHRIDRETSGVVAIGLDERFHGEVRRQFEDREVTKVYQAVVHGCPMPTEGTVDLSIGPARRSRIRLKLEARADGSGLSARTRYRVLRHTAHRALVELFPETGRTHQLRVHMHAIGCPLVGDKVYGVDEHVFFEYLDGAISEASRAALVLDRHALHAARLSFRHPFRDEDPFTIEAPLPADMLSLLDGDTDT